LVSANSGTVAFYESLMKGSDEGAASILSRMPLKGVINRSGLRKKHKFKASLFEPGLTGIAGRTGRCFDGQPKPTNSGD
jgi:hypothetical protein